MNSVVPLHADCQSSEPPRLSIRFGRYGGFNTQAEKSKLDEFIRILKDEFRILKSEVSSLTSDASFLSRLRFDIRPEEPVQFDDDVAYDYWKSVPATLEVAYGDLIETSTGQFVIRSNMHLGDLQKNADPPVITVTLPLESEDAVESTKNSHSLVILYGLALEAQHLKCPPNVINSLLSRASETATDVLKQQLGNSEQKRLSQLRDTINSFLGNPAK